jgi:hypothetical protein
VSRARIPLPTVAEGREHLRWEHGSCLRGVGSLEVTIRASQPMMLGRISRKSVLGG